MHDEGEGGQEAFHKILGILDSVHLPVGMALGSTGATMAQTWGYTVGIVPMKAMQR